jgi:magnesium-transporting ATPase (P-type)
MESSMAVEEDRDPQRQSFWDRLWSGISIQTVIQSAGFLFVLVAAFGFAYAVLKLISSTAASPPASSDLFWQNLVSNNVQVIAIVLIAFLSALFALRLFSKAGSLTSEVIREKDRQLLQPLITGANKEAIDQYIRLASLSGFSGTFTYLGFTGLPLATVALTLILLMISLGVEDADIKRGVFDMAKLTLGAFLGSFVQRNLEQEKLIQGTAGPGSGADGAGSSGSSAQTRVP